MKPAERTEGITKVGVSRVPGVGIGHAVRWRTDPSPLREAGSVDEERTRLGRAIARAKRGVLDLMRLLPRGEAELFEPELLTLDELGTTLRERLVAGMRAEDVVEDGATDTAVDLLMDARARDPRRARARLSIRRRASRGERRRCRPHHGDADPVGRRVAPVPRRGDRCLLRRLWREEWLDGALRHPGARAGDRARAREH